MQAVQQHGLRLETAALDIQVPMQASTEASAVRDADVVMFCVKSTATEEAAREMQPHLAPGTLVLTMQNGVDNDERVRAVLGPSVAVAAAVVYVATAMAGPGHVRHFGRGELVIAPSALSDQVALQFGAAGIAVQVSPDVRGALWAKLVIILNSRWWGVGAVAVVGSALLAGSALAIYAVRVQPVLDGQLTLAGLEQPVRVRRDDADITHISAFSPQDLWRALGHVHAQERGWQLEFNRRLMHGTLSEINR